MNKQRNERRIPELDGLRVIMILIVAWYHIWQQSWLLPEIHLPFLGIEHYSLDYLVRSGYIWVDGTILLSVFLLYLPWAEAKKKDQPMPKAGDFYFRRAKRVIPAYYFIVLCHLLIVALPWKLYEKNTPALVQQYGDKGPVILKDLFTHLSFTFNHFTDTYMKTQLGGAAWTLAVLVQGYLLFPLIARGVRKHPALTLGILLAVGFGYRTVVMLELGSYDMVVNQLMNFLDIYVLGILCATGFIYLRDWLGKLSAAGGKRKWISQVLATAVFFGCVYGMAQMLKVQAALTGGTPDIQKHQMMYRPVFGLLFAGMILSAPFALYPLRFLLGNRVMKFLAGVSMNFYLIHQTVAVHLKSRLEIPFPIPGKLYYGAPPEWMEDAYYWTWQHRYTWLCFGVALVMATAVTYLVEKPGAKLFDWVRKKVSSRSQ